MNQKIIKNKYVPMLFSTPMVQALLDGTKTETRRVVKKPDVLLSRFINADNSINQGLIMFCPYKVGDIIWVRETFFDTTNFKDAPLFQNSAKYIYKTDDGCIGCHNWKPSLYMPKDACRLFLEITEIRVERLHDISNEDCKKEGIKKEIFTPTGEECFYFYPCKDFRDDSYLDSPKTSFYSLWRSINGQNSWDANPFVWAISFKVVECPYGFR